MAAKRIEMSGAAPRLIGIYDTVEQVDCSFLLATDDTLRCLPTPVNIPAAYEFVDPTVKSLFISSEKRLGWKRAWPFLLKIPSSAKARTTTR